jgi:sortase (surface protein transpeptidase)
VTDETESDEAAEVRPGTASPRPDPETDVRVRSRRRRAVVTAVGVFFAVMLSGLLLPSPFGEEQSGSEDGSGSASRTGSGVLPATRLEVPSLDIVAGLTTISMSEGRVLEPPGNVHAVGRWDQSAAYGSRTGRTVLTGHTVYNGGGALGPLPRLQPGELMHVVTPEGRHTYRTTEVMVRSKAWVRRNGTEVFSQPGGDGSLVVVTCTDYDGKDYRSNVIAIAEPINRSDAEKAA